MRREGAWEGSGGAKRARDIGALPRAAAARALCRAGAARACAQCNVWVFCDGAAGCGACSDATFGYRGQTGNNARFGPGGACTRDNKFPRCAALSRHLRRLGGARRLLGSVMHACACA
jgi:hypothetical protein